jgi:hypothetical protein
MLRNRNGSKKDCDLSSKPSPATYPPFAPMAMKYVFAVCAEMIALLA